MVSDTSWPTPSSGARGRIRRRSSVRHTHGLAISSDAATRRCSTISPTPSSTAPRTPGRCWLRTSFRPTDGTGIVHSAPGFGEDDQIVAERSRHPHLCPMDEHGCYTAEIATTPGRMSLTPTSGSSRSEGAKRRLCVTPPTTTRTRIAGAVPNLSFTAPSRPGSCRSRPFATAWLN